MGVKLNDQELVIISELVKSFEKYRTALLQDSSQKQISLSGSENSLRSFVETAATRFYRHAQSEKASENVIPLFVQLLVDEIFKFSNSLAIFSQAKGREASVEEVLNYIKVTLEKRLKEAEQEQHAREAEERVSSAIESGVDLSAESRSHGERPEKMRHVRSAEDKGEKV
jgi:hypothetical protein